MKISRYSAAKGFNIIELVMVMVIISILAVSAIPSFRSYYSLKLEGAVGKLVSDIRYIQQHSISTHESYVISFDTSDESYEVYQLSDSSPVVDPFSGGDMEMKYNTNSEFRGIDIDSVDFDGASELRFSPLGVPRNSSNSDLSSQGTITLTYKGLVRNITIEPETGRVSGH